MNKLIINTTYFPDHFIGTNIKSEFKPLDETMSVGCKFNPNQKFYWSGVKTTKNKTNKNK